MKKNKIKKIKQNKTKQKPSFCEYNLINMKNYNFLHKTQILGK